MNPDGLVRVATPLGVEATEPSWRTGQYRQGVLDTATYVEEHARRNLRSHEAGAKLYRQALGLKDPTPDQPRLLFPSVSKTSRRVFSETIEDLT